MTDLQLYPQDGETVADLLAKAAQARALTDIVKDAQAHVDGRLRSAVEETEAATGTAFTARRDGWSAVLTDPQPKPRITDRDAFADWARLSTDLPIEMVDRVEVVDHAIAAATVRAWERGEPLVCDAGSPIASALKVTTEYALPEDPITPLVKSGRCIVTADGMVDTETGETVPGVDVTVANPTLQVRGDKDAKAAARREVADIIGLAPQLAGGGS